MQSPHNSAQAFHPGGIGNYRHTFAQSIFFIIQSGENFAARRAVHTQG